jgi:hypothetical protein
MHRARDGHMNLTTHIDEAWPQCAPKWIVRALGGISLRTGRRIAESGHAPRRLRERIVNALEAQLARREARIRELRRELAEERIRLEAAAAQAQRAGGGGHPAGAGSAEGPAAAQVLADD